MDRTEVEKLFSSSSLARCSRAYESNVFGLSAKELYPFAVGIRVTFSKQVQDEDGSHDIGYERSVPPYVLLAEDAYQALCVASETVRGMYVSPASGRAEITVAGGAGESVYAEYVVEHYGLRMDMDGNVGVRGIPRVGGGHND